MRSCPTRQFRWAIVSGLCISGLLFWASFTHWRIVEGIVAGATITLLYWFRFASPKEQRLLRGKGSRREVMHFRVTVAVLAAFVVLLAVILVAKS
jgi:hypothetical protein